MFDWQHACRHNATCQEPELVPYDARDRVSLCADVHHIRHGHALLAGDHIYSASVEQYHRLLILRVLQSTESSTSLPIDRGGTDVATSEDSDTETQHAHKRGRHEQVSKVVWSERDPWRDK